MSASSKLTLKWLNVALHEERITLTPEQRTKLALRLDAMLCHEKANALVQIATVLSHQANEMRKGVIE